MASPILPPAKRTRTDETSDEYHEAQIDQSFWFEDGNIVIVAQQTAFRVHRGVLSRHSETFSGLFTLPRPIDGAAEETRDGCPVVRVTDSSYDFKHLLHALYDGLGYMESVAECRRYSMYASLARLGHKYQLDAVFSAALQRLKATYTDDFGVWCEVWATHYTGLRLVHSTGISPIEAVNLFRTTGQTNLLPTALYLSNSLPIEMLLDGVPRADGTREQLSKGDLRRCLEARDTYNRRLAHSWVQSYTLLVPPRECAQWGRSCKHVIASFREYPLESSFAIPRDVFSLVRLCRSMINLAKESSSLCTACADMLIKGAQKVFDEQWDALPETLLLANVVTNWSAAVPS